MIDLNFLRSNPDVVRLSEKNRYRSPAVVDLVIALDNDRRRIQFLYDQHNKALNLLQARIHAIRPLSSDLKELSVDPQNESSQKPIVETAESKGDSDGLKIVSTPEPSKNTVEDDTNHEIIPIADILNKEKLKTLTHEQLIEIRSNIKKKRDVFSTSLTSIKAELNAKFNSIGNILDSSVFISNDEANNPIICKYPPPFTPKTKLPFATVCAKLGADYKRGSRVSGHRGYFLTGTIARLAMALEAYAVDFLSKRGFTVVLPPLLLKKDVMERTCQLSDFDDQLYKVDDSFLIATSEQPIASLYMGETLTGSKRLCGVSQCFRKEAGAHGKDCTGIFRVHTFNKVEQFVICRPSESEAIFEELIGNCKDFYESLELGYQVVGIVSGALNDAAAKKVDLEAYFPVEKRYRELVSCSNCSDYQSRALNVKIGGKYCHMLNCTMIAIQRTICCIAENYQEEGGMRVPKVLVDYMGKDFLEYTH